MRAILICLACVITTKANADVSSDIASLGLTGAREALEALRDPTTDEQFALAGVLFLETIEQAYQARWTYGMSGATLPLPMFQGNLPPNPEPEAFQPETVRNITTAFVTDLAQVTLTLDAIPADADPAVSLALPDLWFDANVNGQRDDGEGLVDIVLPLVLSRFELRRFNEARAENPDARDPRSATIRFDKADLYWLAAYAQVLQGVGELVLAFDPTDEIDKVLTARAAFAAQFATMHGDDTLDQIVRDLRKRNPDMTDAEAARLTAMLQGGNNPVRQFADPVDIGSIVVETLRHQPDPQHIGRARDHFVAMVGHNRDFWQALAMETDNTAEWIPNPDQTAALGIELPGEIGPAWLDVLTDLERTLNGDLLVPFWRFAPGFGIDLDAYVRDPSPIAIVEWAQGAAALPYARPGEVVGTDSWRAFSRLVRGQTGMFVILLN
ncbi:MAG: hypothetical protein AAGM21_00695 [Pseudomonadota bacterium]